MPKKAFPFLALCQTKKAYFKHSQKYCTKKLKKIVQVIKSALKQTKTIEKIIQNALY